jgi:hypothetical protein
MLLERQAREREEKFTRWLEAPLELRYHDGLNKRFQQYQNAQDNRSKERGRFAAFFMGDPRENYDKALDDLVFDALFYLYNFWKDSIHENLLNLNQHLGTLAVLETLPEQPDLLTLLRLPEVRARFEENFPNLLLFDLLYNQVIDGLPSIAGELKGSNRISEESVAKLFDEALERALAQLEQSELPVDREQTRKRFFDWLSAFISQKTCDEVMGTISAWKRVVFPRMSPPLFGLVRYYFSGLLPSLHTAQQGSGKFDGKITPKAGGLCTKTGGNKTLPLRYIKVRRTPRLPRRGGALIYAPAGKCMRWRRAWKRGSGRVTMPASGSASSGGDGHSADCCHSK